VLDRCIELIEKRAGRRPTGYVAPWWEFSGVTNELLLERGIKYDHSLMHRDFEPYYVRVGDSFEKTEARPSPLGVAHWLGQAHSTDPRDLFVKLPITGSHRSGLPAFRARHRRAVAEENVR
jgi:hypothetical protein